MGTPRFPEPEVVGAVGGAAEASRLLRERCEAGMVRRCLDRDTAALQRLEEELAVIAELRYDTYFLTVAQVVADVREMGIRVAPRGSGAGPTVRLRPRVPLGGSGREEPRRSPVVPRASVGRSAGSGDGPGPRAGPGRSFGRCR